VNYNRQVASFLLLSTLITMGCSPNVPPSATAVSAAIKQRGYPDLVCTSFTVKKNQQGLRVAIIAGVTVKPAELENSLVCRDKILVYATGPDLKRYAGYYYSERNSDPQFSGSIWYSSRGLFGESVIVLYVDALGMVIKTEDHRIDAASIRQLNSGSTQLAP
jgi:hypothetical protein